MRQRNITLLALAGAVAAAIYSFWSSYKYYLTNLEHFQRIESAMQSGMQWQWWKDDNVLRVFVTNINWVSFGMIVFFIILLVKKDKLRSAALIGAGGAALQLIQVLVVNLWEFRQNPDVWDVLTRHFPYQLLSDYLLDFCSLAAVLVFFVLLALHPTSKQTGWAALAVTVFWLARLIYPFQIAQGTYFTFDTWLIISIITRVLVAIWFAHYFLTQKGTESSSTVQG